LNFRNYTISLPSGDINTFNVLTEQEFCSIRHKAQYGKPSNNISHTMASPSNINDSHQCRQNNCLRQNKHPYDSAYGKGLLPKIRFNEP